MQARWRLVVPSMRAVFVVGGVLVAAAAVQLYLLTDHTDRFFAWTITPGISAAFLGAFYATAFVLAVGSAAEREWASARVGVFGVWVFVTLTLVATLLHIDKFHFDDPELIPRAAAWLWTIVYVVAPVGVSTAIVLQLRAPGQDPRPERPLVVWYRILLSVEAGALVCVGLVLFVAPSSVTWWPWALTPLVARAMAAWLLGLAVVLATAAWENDRDRIRMAPWSAVALGILQLVALLRYPNDLRGGISMAVYVALLVLIVLTGALGVVQSFAASKAR